MRIITIPAVTFVCLAGAITLIVATAHAAPEFVRDVAVPPEVPPPVDDWVTSPRAAASLFSDAMAALEADDAAKALKLVEQAIAFDSETNPAERGYYAFRAECMTELGDRSGAAAVSFYNEALESSNRGAFADARRFYDRAMMEDPLMLWAANNRAWLAATHPDPEVRKDPDAAMYAVYACVKSDWRNWSFIDTLGAVFAESGDYDSAVRCTERALDIAPPEHLQELRNALVAYRMQQPRRVEDTDEENRLEDDEKSPFAETDESADHGTVRQRITVWKISETMKQEGYAVTIRDESYVEWRIDGRKSQIFVADDGQSLQFHAAFLDTQATLATVNDWNRSKKYSRSYLDKDGDPHLELDLDLSGGITEARVIDFLATCRQSFERWVKDVID